MKSFKSIWITLAVLTIVFISCSKEFVPERNLLDKPVVYAILNHGDTKHYVRVSRSFIQPITGEMVSAPVYNPDSLEVLLEVYRYGQRAGHTVIMTPEYVDKDSGIFDHTKQLIYSTELALKEDSECRLTIINRENGESLSARCNLFYLQEFKLMIVGNLTRLDFYSLPDVFFYEVNCLFHFVEVSETDTVFQTISYPIGTAINGTKEERLNMSMSLERPDWWDFLERHIPINPDVKRFALERPLEFTLLVGDQYLFDYRRSFSGYETMIHTGQSFSNIQGGFGIFSAYDEKTLFWQAMIPDWYDKLSEHPQTQALNFANHPWL